MSKILKVTFQIQSYHQTNAELVDQLERDLKQLYDMDKSKYYFNLTSIELTNSSV